MDDGTRFNPEEFERTMQALRDGTSAADMPVRPMFDPVQHRNVVEESVHGRRIENYRTALERAGFVFYPKGSIPPGCQSTNPLEPPRPIMTGQWRRLPSGTLQGLAFTDDQILSWFQTPEDFWRWIKDMTTKPQMQAKRQASQPLRLAMHR